MTSVVRVTKSRWPSRPLNNQSAPMPPYEPSSDPQRAHDLSINGAGWTGPLGAQEWHQREKSQQPNPEGKMERFSHFHADT